MLFVGFSDTARRIAVATLVMATFFTGKSWAGEFTFRSETSARFQEGQFLPAIFVDPYPVMNQAGIRPFKVTAVANASGIDGATQHAVTFVNISAAWQVVTLGNFTAMNTGNIPDSFLIGPKETKIFFGIEFYDNGSEQYIEFRTDKNAIRAFGARAADALARGRFAIALSSSHFSGDNLAELVGAVVPDIALDVLTNLLSSNGTDVNNILAENLNRAVQSSKPHTESIASLMQRATNNPDAAREYKALAALNALDAILTIKSALEIPEKTNLTLELIGGTIASPNEATVFLRAIPQGKPKITHIDHVRGLNGYQPIQIRGLGFQREAKVTLTASDRSYPIPASRTFFVSESLIEISANVTDVTDLWFAQVENPGGQMSVRFFFLVVAFNQWARFWELTNPRPAETQQINVLPLMELLGALRDSLIDFLNQIDVEDGMGGGDGLGTFNRDNYNFVLTSEGTIVVPTAEGSPTPGGSPGIPANHKFWPKLYIVRGGDPDEYYWLEGWFDTAGDAEAQIRGAQALWTENRFSDGPRKADRLEGLVHHADPNEYTPPYELITIEGLAERYPLPWNEGPRYATVESGGMTPVKLHRPWYMGTPVFVWSLEPGAGSIQVEEGGWYLEWTLPRNTTRQAITYTLFLEVNPNPNTWSPPRTFRVTVLPEYVEPPDTTPPVISGIVDREVTNRNVTLTWNEGRGTLDGTSVESGHAVRGEGTHRLSVTDAAGNTTSLSFIVDLTPPAIFGLLSGDVYLAPITPTFSDSYGIKSATLAKDGAPARAYASGASVTESGSYTLVVEDMAGNKRTYTFTLNISVVNEAEPPVVVVELEPEPIVEPEPAPVGTTQEPEPEPEPTPEPVTPTPTPTPTPVPAPVIPTPTVTPTPTTPAQEPVTPPITENPPVTPAPTEEPVGDRTPPRILGAVDGITYHSAVTPVFEDASGVTALLIKDGTLPGMDWMSGRLIQENGAYTLVVIDGARNASQVVFIVDIPPSILEFTVTLQKGANILHVPVAVEELEHVSDLVRLLGEENVEKVISKEGDLFSFFFPGVTKADSVWDSNLKSYSAVILQMRREVQITFRGKVLEGTIELQRGLNLIGVPRNGAIKKVSDLAALSEHITKVMWDDRAGGSQFIQYPATDGEIRGGRGLVVMTDAEVTLMVEGDAWRNEATDETADPETQTQTAPHALASPNQETQLLPNYPNPFNPETWIPFTLGEDNFLTFTVYGMTGSPVRVIELGFMSAGAYVTREKAIRWDGTNDDGEPVASGIYFTELVATSGFRAMRRLIVAR